MIDAMEYIPYARQWIDDGDIEAVVEVLRSDWLTQGPAIEKFESAVANYCGVRYGVAVSSGTAALHLACLSAGLKEGDILWTSPNSFVASANCALYCGANPDFVDIDPLTCNMSVTMLEEKLRKADREGTLPKIIIPVHFAGQSCEMEGIHELAGRYGLTVIEDASHALGGRYKGTPIGSCAFSDIAVTSFHPVKIITAGEGGMILTNRKDIYERLIRLRTHGITRDEMLMTEGSHGPWYYQQIDLGYNYRMSDIHAALGASQMKRIDGFVKRRHELADRYAYAMRDLPLSPLLQLSDCYSAFHLYVIHLKGAGEQEVRGRLFEKMRTAGVGVNLHYIPIHTQPYYMRRGFRWGDFPEAERHYRRAMSLPLYYGLTEEKQDYVVSVIKKGLQ